MTDLKIDRTLAISLTSISEINLSIMSELAFAQSKRVMRQIKFTEDEFNCDEAEVTIEQA